MRRAAQILLSLAALLGPIATCAASPWDNARPVATAELVAAMRAEKDQGYAVESIANSNRLLTGVFLALAEKAAAADQARHPLRVGHEEYFDALVEVAGLAPLSAPIHVRTPKEFHQDYLIDYRAENVIARIEHGAAPALALNVKGGWPRTPNAPANYSYEDKSSLPHVEVTHQQVVSYRILRFGDIIVCADIRGITGRVTSGALGVIFDVLGKAQALNSRYVIAPDGMMLSRAGAKKLFTVNKTVAIYPDGRLLSDLPDDRPELDNLAEALKNLDVEISFVPMDRSAVPAPGP